MNCLLPHEPVSLIRLPGIVLLHIPFSSEIQVVMVQERTLEAAFLWNSLPHETHQISPMAGLDIVPKSFCFKKSVGVRRASACQNLPPHNCWKHSTQESDREQRHETGFLQEIKLKLLGTQFPTSLDRY